jgi:F1F0 ATPase subunit 2
MNQTAMIIAGIPAGAALGLLYFGGLWWTLKRLPAARRPAALALGSYAGRLAACLFVFVLLARVGGWPAVAAVLIAFLLARMVLVRVWGPGPAGGPAAVRN